MTPGAEVKYRGLTIGSVKSLEAVGYGKQRMALLLDPAKAGAEPADERLDEREQSFREGALPLEAPSAKPHRRARLGGRYAVGEGGRAEGCTDEDRDAELG